MTDNVDSPVVEAAKSLKVIATMSVGFDHLGKNITEILTFAKSKMNPVFRC